MLSIDGVYIKSRTFLWKNHAENMQQKLVPGLCIILVNNPNNHCMQKSVLKVRYFERVLSKSLKKGNFIFSFEPSPFQ